MKNSIDLEDKPEVCPGLSFKLTNKVNSSNILLVKSNYS